MEKVLYIGGFKLPDKNAAAHRVLANAKIFSSLGADVLLVGQDDNIKSRIELKSIENYSQKVRLFSNPYPTSLKTWLFYLFDDRWIKELIIKHNIDTLVLYNFPSFAILRLLPYLKKNKIKVVADCTEWYGSPDGNVIKKLIKNFDTFLRMRYINFKVDGIICISTFLHDFYSTQNTVLIPPLIDETDSKWPKNISETADKTINFVYAGQMGKKDKIADVLNSIYTLQNQENFKFHIIGISREEFLKSNPMHFKINNFVKFYGRLPHVDSIKIITKADFMIFFREDNRTSRAGFPTKFVEAISCGVPVITNKSSNIADYLIEGKNGYFISNNLSEINHTISKLLVLPKTEITKMKVYCANNNNFNYLNYQLEMADFIKKL